MITEDGQTKERIIYLDLLRIFATFAVIIAHTSAQNWFSVNIKSLEWNLFNIWDSAMRWSVPVFAMISGALFLGPNKKINIKNLYTKNICRIATVFIFWSFVYDVYFVINDKITGHMFIINLIAGHYHMWFLFMIAGFYIIVPLVREITKNDYLMKYYLIVSFIFNFVLNTFLNIIVNLFELNSRKSIAILNGHFNNMQINFIIGYTFYYIVGYYLSSKKMSKKERIFIYILALIGFFSTVILSIIVSRLKNEPWAGAYGDFMINVMFESIGMFVFIKNIKVSIKWRKIILTISKYTFGIYLIHPLILEILNNSLEFNTLSFNPILSVPIISILIFVIGAIMSSILNRIPILKDYIV